MIGEEIYDEFDPQGHPDLKSFAQNEVKTTPATLKRKLSAPELAGNISRALPAASPGAAVLREMGKSSTATPSMKPTLSALKGLNFKNLTFTRSKSAPPSPTEEKSPVLSEKNRSEAAPAPDDTHVDNSLTAQVGSESSVVDVANSTPAYSAAEGTFTRPLWDSPPQVIANAATNVSTSATQSTRNRPADITHGLSSPADSIPSPHIINPALILPITSTRSPSPSLEQAILVERKRRAVSGMSSSPVPKGTRFKSSPLTGSRGGVVVAEKVRGEGATNVPEGDHVRIPDEKVKKGPDKE